MRAWVRRTAALHGELHDGSADAGARRKDVGALHRGEHRLLVSDRLRRDGNRLLGERALGEQRQRCGQHDCSTHPGVPFQRPNHRIPHHLPSDSWGRIDMAQGSLSSATSGR